jgi:hypothetical protein
MGLRLTGAMTCYLPFFLDYPCDLKPGNFRGIIRSWGCGSIPVWLRRRPPRIVAAPPRGVSASTTSMAPATAVQRRTTPLDGCFAIRILR